MYGLETESQHETHAKHDTKMVWWMCKRVARIVILCCEHCTPELGYVVYMRGVMCSVVCHHGGWVKVDHYLQTKSGPPFW